MLSRSAPRAEAARKRRPPKPPPVARMVARAVAELPTVAIGYRHAPATLAALARYVQVDATQLVDARPADYPDSTIGQFLLNDAYFQAGASSDPDAAAKRTITYGMLLTHTAGLFSVGSWNYPTYRGESVLADGALVQSKMYASFSRLENHYGANYRRPSAEFSAACAVDGFVGVPGGTHECIYDEAEGWQRARTSTLRKVARYVLRQPRHHRRVHLTSDERRILRPIRSTQLLCEVRPTCDQPLALAHARFRGRAAPFVGA